ncbi:MAG: integrase/recombinase XerC [Pseudonocardiales bacterium]|nr:integrase/recombinase XerC [Pseudonocardiales bacterium]
MITSASAERWARVGWPYAPPMLTMIETPGEWLDAIAAFLTALRAAGRPDTTIGLRHYQLRRLAAAMAPSGPWEVTGEQLVEWVGGQSWGREYRRSWRSAIRGFYRWAHGAGYVERDPALALPSVDPRPPKPRPAPEDAYRLALASADDRVRLMLRLAAELGMRRGEVARVHNDDLERDLAGWTLRVNGKGERLRRLPISDGLRAAIAKRGAGYLFPGNDAGHLSPAYVGKLVSRTLPGAWAMHSLRHRFATLAYSLDRDVFTVQELLGHASPVTTRLYVQVPVDSMRRTVLAVAGF